MAHVLDLNLDHQELLTDKAVSLKHRYSPTIFKAFKM